MKGLYVILRCQYSYMQTNKKYHIVVLDAPLIWLIDALWENTVRSPCVFLIYRHRTLISINVFFSIFHYMFIVNAKQIMTSRFNNNDNINIQITCQVYSYYSEIEMFLDSIFHNYRCYELFCVFWFYCKLSIANFGPADQVYLIIKSHNVKKNPRS